MPSKQPWYRLDIRRTRWYDLLVPEDRVEAMKGIWAVLGFMMRKKEEDMTAPDVQEKEGKGKET